MSEFTVRPATEADQIFIREMNGRLIDVIDAPTHSRQDVAAFQDRFTATALATDAGASATFVAIATDGQRLGYVNVRSGMDEVANEECGYISLLAVVTEAEGEGVGQSLLSVAEKWTRDAGFCRLSLDVFASNHRGQSFYEKAGFRPETLRLIKRL